MSVALLPRRRLHRVSFHQGNSAQKSVYVGGSMEPEIHRPQPEAPLDGMNAAANSSETVAPSLGERIFDWLNWTFIGSERLRAGWSVLIFIPLFILLANVVGFVFSHFYLLGKKNDFT